MIEITSIITTLLGLLAGGGLSWVFTLKSARRAAQAEVIGKEQENMRAVAEEWHRMAEERQEVLQALRSEVARNESKIDELYKEISKLRTSLDECHKTAAEMQITITKNEPMLCHVRSCPNRKPCSNY